MVHMRSDADIAFAAIFLVMLILISVLGNTAVIIAILISNELRGDKSNVLIINLAITDLTNGLTVMVSSLSSLVADKWILGQGLCSMICAVNYCLIITSMLTLCFISYDRYNAIKHPLSYIQWITNTKLSIAIAYSWFQGIAFSIVPVIFQWVQYDYWEAVCAIEWQKEKEQAVYYVVTAFLLCFFIPGLSLAFNYFQVLREVKRMAKSIQPVTVTILNNSKSDPFQNSKIVKSLLVVVLAYFVCMTPFSVTKLIKVIVSDPHFVPGWINTSASLIAYCSSAVNPLVYGLLRNEFRMAYKKIVRKILHPTRTIHDQ